MRPLQNWRIFIAVGFAAGIISGLFRAWERAPLRNHAIPDIYFTEASAWLCIQHKWSSDAGKRQAVNALAKTYLAKTDSSVAALVGQTKTALEAGRPLSSCP